jgi:hypothetical protein
MECCAARSGSETPAPERDAAVPGTGHELDPPAVAALISTATLHVDVAETRPMERAPDAPSAASPHARTLPLLI